MNFACLKIVLESRSEGGWGGAEESGADEFEEQTGGENFVKGSVHLSQLTEKQSKKKEDEDDMNDFFDEFERKTGGENFRRKT